MLFDANKNERRECYAGMKLVRSTPAGEFI
jgi:hypothetical protein